MKHDKRPQLQYYNKHRRMIKYYLIARTDSLSGKIVSTYLEVTVLNADFLSSNSSRK